MPAGMSKVLELLGSAMDICDPNGELTVNETEFVVEKKEAKITQKNLQEIYNNMYEFLYYFTFIRTLITLYNRIIW